jgi:thiamine phosphate synthase YjbQ (UPF0047 family)
VAEQFNLNLSSPLAFRRGGVLITHTEYVTFNTKKRYEILDITEHVEKVRSNAQLRDGYILVSAMHITASVFVNDHESGHWSDIMEWL